MVDPHAITRFNRTHAELEELLLNAISFAGKNAVQQAQKMHAFLFAETNDSPFKSIRDWHADNSLMSRLIESKIGKYRLLEHAFRELAHSGIDLTNCTITDLTHFPGIGEKTARLFILHSRPRQQYVVIDTHVLKEMRLLGFTELLATPTGTRYLELEKLYISHLRTHNITDFAAHDLGIWNKYTRPVDNET